MPEYAADKAGAGTEFGKNGKIAVIFFKGSENSEKSDVFTLITSSKNDTPDGEAGTLSGVQFLHSMKKYAEH